MSFEPAIYGLIVAIVGGTIAGTATIINQKKAMVKEVKEHTDDKIDGMQDILKVRLENVELKINNQGEILKELKQVSTEDMRNLRTELSGVKVELNKIQLEGPAGVNFKTQIMIDRVDSLEKKIDLLWQRALTDETRSEKRERKESTPNNNHG